MSERDYGKQVASIGCGLALAALFAFGSALAFVAAAMALVDVLTGGEK